MAITTNPSPEPAGSFDHKLDLSVPGSITVVATLWPVVLSSGGGKSQGNRDAEIKREAGGDTAECKQRGRHVESKGKREREVYGNRRRV